jgi:hypothetical protein
MMLFPQNSSILDENDEIMQIEFQDPEEPSAFNECAFNEVVQGRNIFNRLNQEESWCQQIVDEVFANYN